MPLILILNLRIKLQAIIKTTERLREMAEWLAENSIIDPEIPPLARKGFISKVTIIECEETQGYYVTMRIKPHEETFHLATRRIRNKPRIYMNLERLVTHIREKMSPLKEVKLVLVPGLEKKAKKQMETSDMEE